MQKLIEFWAELTFNQKPYVHPQDGALNINLCYSSKDVANYYEEKYWTDNSIFHTDLLPIPYAGNLNNAKIFILLLNPGLSFIDYYSEYSSFQFVEALKDTLHQQYANHQFPFIFLNPNFFWTGGGQYWLRKLKDYIKLIKSSRSCTYIEATRFLSQRVAILELMPYHSSTFTEYKLLDKLESVRQMREFVKRFVLPKVYLDQACIICTRQSKEWNLEPHHNIVIYGKSETRGAHLSKNTRAFQLFEKFLELK